MTGMDLRISKELLSIRSLTKSLELLYKMLLFQHHQKS
ncbi:hydrogenase [Escherichia coli]|nr:hydrogenase [Escherichia coli]EFN8423767.1 hydrogenase [Escherichia coli O145]EFN8624523.1 hydrogenase [Escherichia coli O51]EHW38204.1 efa1/LifA-like domain protein [Escherichia coli DEC9B]EHW49953.1 efa1/LifA-like domain protein [Escherichia coli DEC9D]EHW88913.1 efa1/LifA-like domain protein [Escherichia coli DEC11A]EHX17171.1 efa1/LifA-like domain protein [Escherichia coli DEC11E]EHX23785.1 efa1/LifA-like domain protein [Escherichia coli DEC12B]EHX30455.1 efa1/LifA-like domain protei